MSAARHRRTAEPRPAFTLRKPGTAAERKRSRSGRDNPEHGDLRHGNAGKAAKPTAATRYAVYSGQDRLGSYGQAGDAWVAFTRLGHLLGVFNSERAAIDAIDSGAKP